MGKILTLIGIKLAEKNRKFLLIGGAEECINCNSSLKSVCLDNIEKGRVYIINEVRKKVLHPCPVHEGGVTVVEVQKASIQSAIDSKLAREGATISFPPVCNEVSCINYHLCKPLGIQSGEKCKVIKIFGNLPQNCKIGKRLVLAELKP
jgi:hypothetical protein